MNLAWYARRLARMSPAEVRGRLADAWLKHRWRARQLAEGEPDPLPLPPSVPAFASALDPALAEALPEAARARLLRTADAALAGHFPIFDRERDDLSRDPDWFLTRGAAGAPPTRPTRSTSIVGMSKRSAPSNTSGSRPAITS